MVYDHQSCPRSHQLFPVISRSLHLGIEKEHVNTGVWVLNCCAPLFARVIAGSYKRWRCSPLRVRHVCLCFSTRGSLKRHQESVHRQSVSFSCQVCGQRFYRKDHLARHLKTHRVACPTDVTVDFAAAATALSCSFILGMVRISPKSGTSWSTPPNTNC